MLIPNDHMLFHWLYPHISTEWQVFLVGYQLKLAAVGHMSVLKLDTEMVHVCKPIPIANQASCLSHGKIQLIPTPHSILMSQTLTHVPHNRSEPLMIILNNTQTKIISQVVIFILLHESKLISQVVFSLYCIESKLIIIIYSSRLFTLLLEAKLISQVVFSLYCTN